MMAASSAPDTPTADDFNGGGLRPAATSVSLLPVGCFMHSIGNDLEHVAFTWVHATCSTLLFFEHLHAFG
jgi:hypothetical protein